MLKNTFLFISFLFCQVTPVDFISQQPFPVVASIRRLDTSQEVFQHRGNEWISPASTWKIFSVANANQKLTSSYRFRTSVTYSGSILDQILWGDLIIEGTGDPTLGSERWPSVDPMAKLINSLKSLGIRQIQGQVRLKSEFLHEKIPDSWVWGDIGNYYGAVPQNFNYGENKFTVFFESGNKVGAPSQVVSIQPQSTNWKINNLVTTGPEGSGDQVMIYSAPGSSVITLRGTVPLGSRRFPVKGSVHQPFELFKEILRQRMNKEGIEWIQAETPDHSPEHQLVIWESPTLREIGAICLAESVNLFADALLIKAWDSDFSISWPELQSRIPAKDLPTPFWRDGSGLSSQNIIQPSRFSAYLTQITQENEVESWAKWLPELGKAGTVKSFQPVGIPIFLKSGSIQGVRTYAGYFKSRGGTWYSFFVGAYPIAPDQNTKVRPFFQKFFEHLGQFP